MILTLYITPKQETKLFSYMIKYTDITMIASLGNSRYMFT